MTEHPYHRVIKELKAYIKGLALFDGTLLEFIKTYNVDGVSIEKNNFS